MTHVPSLSASSSSSSSSSLSFNNTAPIESTPPSPQECYQLQPTHPTYLNSPPSSFSPPTPSHLPYNLFHIQHDPVADRRSLISLLSGLFHLGCKLTFITMCIYITVHFGMALQHDVKLKIEEYESDQLEHYFHIQEQYEINRCDPSTRLPDLQEQCRLWQRELFRIVWVGKTKVLAEVLAEILNSFIGTISLKSMVSE
ncbi:Di-sulfide bridge nucleocytoplasmic transport domain-containing protein [Spinellus fusiger]|nr:Di-sulfide bridge nucleocytoplasmic transport domain-containing protein [Spinellus fusiger]